MDYRNHCTDWWYLNHGIFSKVAQYEYTGCGLTMQDNIDIVSGWDCTTQDTVVQALAGNVYFSEPKMHEGQPLTSYFSAPLWKDGIADTEIIGSVIFMSNDYFLQDIVKEISLSNTCQVVFLDQHGNTIADSSQETLSAIINTIELSKEDSSYKGFASIVEKMVAGKTGFGVYGLHYVAYAPVEGMDGWSIAVSVSMVDYIAGFILGFLAIIVVVVVAIFVSIKTAKRLGKDIATPINGCADRIRLLAEGDLHTEVVVDDSLEEAERRKLYRRFCTSFNISKRIACKIKSDSVSHSGIRNTGYAWFKSDGD